MVSFGFCPYCREQGKQKTDHHIFPTRFTNPRKKSVKRLDVLFPEFFQNGEKDDTVALCDTCHRKADGLIPHSLLMTPDKYYLLHEKMSLGEAVNTSIVNEWLEESFAEIKRRKRIYHQAWDSLFWFFAILLVRTKGKRRI